MSTKLIGIDNFIFITCALVSALVCYLTLGVENITLGVVSVMFTFVVFSAKPDNGDYVYTFLWVAIILLGCYIGILFHLSVAFYLFLFFVSVYYYISFERDTFSARAIPFMVIYASLGTTMKALEFKSALSFLMGSVIALIILGFAHHRKIEFTAFKNGIFSKTLYANPPHIFVSAFVYSVLLFSCLYLPDHFGLERVYWAPMTFIILLKPKDQDTIKNTIDRFIGSIVGAVVVFILLNIEGHYKIINLGIIALCVFLLPSFFKLKNWVKTFGITVFILVLLESAEFWKDPNYTLPYARIYETFIGGMIAILGSFVLRQLQKFNTRTA